MDTYKITELINAMDMAIETAAHRISELVYDAQGIDDEFRKKIRDVAVYLKAASQNRSVRVENPYGVVGVSPTGIVKNLGFFGGLKSNLSVEEGLAMFDRDHEKIKSTDLEFASGRKCFLAGSAIRDVCLVPTVTIPELNNPDHWKEEEVLYPFGAEDGDTDVSVLIKNFTSCRCDENSLTFFFEEHGKGSIRFNF